MKRSLIDILDFSPEELQELIDTANDIIARPEAYSRLCSGKKLANIVHRILQARILEWVAFPFSRGSSQPRDQTGGPLHCRWILYQLSYTSINLI